MTVLSPLAQRVARSITTETCLAIAHELIRIPSFTGAETALANHVHMVLRANGIASELQEVQPGRFQTLGRVGKGAGQPALILNGHLDMDPLDREWGDDPFSPVLHGDKLYGAGVHNMKSGLAAILAAALAIQKSGMCLSRPLALQFVVGELQGGIGTTFALASGAVGDCAVIPEPYSVRRIITRTAGVHKVALVVRGKAAHTSRANEGVDAIAVMRDLLDHLDATRLPLTSQLFPALPRVQIASLVAGRGEQHALSGVSYCADKATALIDIRYPPPYDPDTVQQAVERLVESIRPRFPGAQLRVVHPPDPEFTVGGVDMPPMDVDHRSGLVRDLTAILPQVSSYQVEATGVVFPFSYCGNDTAHLSRAGIECCLFGPRGADGDTERHVLLTELQACAASLAALAVLRCGDIARDRG